MDTTEGGVDCKMRGLGSLKGMVLEVFKISVMHRDAVMRGAVYIERH